MFNLKDLLTLIKGRKALPIGTERTWQGQRYVKHNDGWVAVTGKHHGKKSDKKSGKPEMVHSAVATQVLLDNPEGHGIEDLHPEQAQLEGGFKGKKAPTKNRPAKQKKASGERGVMQDAKKIEDEVTKFFVEGVTPSNPNAQKIVDNINSFVKGDIKTAFRPKGGKQVYVPEGDKGIHNKARGGEPKADLVVETTEKKYRISIKAGEAFVATFGSAEGFMNLMGGITKDPEILRRAQAVADTTGYVNNYSRSEKQQDWFVNKIKTDFWGGYLSIPKKLPGHDTDKILSEVETELKARFKENRGDYSSNMKNKQQVMKDFFNWLETEKNDVYMGIYQEAYRGTNQFGPKSDATADFIVNMGSGEMDELTNDYIKNNYTKRDQLFGVPRRGVSGPGLKNADDKVAYIVDSVTKVQLSIKI